MFDKYVAATELVSLTRNTITSPEELRREVERVHKQGYAFDLEECEIGARCVAVPLRDHRGRAVAAISISGPAARFGRRAMDGALKILLKAAGKLSPGLVQARAVSPTESAVGFG
jgi:DNA-binding IclR family transcriptional regulator